MVETRKAEEIRNGKALVLPREEYDRLVRA